VQDRLDQVVPLLEHVPFADRDERLASENVEDRRAGIRRLKGVAVRAAAASDRGGHLLIGERTPEREGSDAAR